MTPDPPRHVEPEACDIAFRAAVPHVDVVDGAIVAVSPATTSELGCDASALLGPLEQIGSRLDDATFEDVIAGRSDLRVRLGIDLDERPIRLRRLAHDGDVVHLEVRSLAHEFRMESLLRRSGHAHMLLNPDVSLEWSVSSNDLSAVLPGDDPTAWIELMDADDMRILGETIAEVGADSALRRTVSHRLNADRTYTIIDEVESAMHDPDLRAVLVRSRLGDMPPRNGAENAEPYAGLAVSDHMPIGVIIASSAGKVLHRNAVAAELVGARLGLAVMPDGDGPWMLERLDDVQTARYQAVFAAAIAGRPAHCTIASPFGRNRWLRVSVSPAAASTVVLTIEDTTELAIAERAVRASNRLLEALDSHSEDAVVVFDARGHSTYRSSSWLFDDEESKVEHVDEFGTLVHADDRAHVDEIIRMVRSNTSASHSFQFRLIRPESPVGRWHTATMTNHLDDPDIRGLVLTVRDVHERHLAEAELAHRANHDALTQLPDRAAFQNRLDELLSSNGASSSRTALMFFDLDNFKIINDRAGHHVGDLVLQTVADRLFTNVRESDFVGRFGGDEFVVVAPDIVDGAHAMDLAERLFTELTGPAECDGFAVDISVSMGVAITDAECSTPAVLLQRADRAMYDAKSAGRGRVVRYRSDTEGLVGDAELGGDIDEIISEQLTVHYQPMQPLHRGLPRGYETFARWNHPVLGVIPASRFLPNVDLTATSGVLGPELLRLIADDERPWLSASEFVCVNVSSAQLDRPGAADEFLDLMRVRGVGPGSLVVELTEASFGQGPTVQSNLKAFRAAGTRVFLDDYGVGYSSLSELHRFPVDGVKIDTSIVHPTVDESLVKLIVGVASTLGIRTVAKSVETEDQLEAVTRLGVDYAQGFLIGEPARVPTTASRS